MIVEIAYTSCVCGVAERCLNTMTQGRFLGGLRVRPDVFLLPIVDQFSVRPSVHV